MPCRSDYMEPTTLEHELSNVYQLLDEVKTGKKLTKDYGSGTDSRVYNRGMNQKDLDAATAELCTAIKKSKWKPEHFSLELQMWWRDHQEADKRHKREDAKAKREAKLVKQALAKLTPKERKLLEK